MIWISKAPCILLFIHDIFIVEWLLSIFYKISWPDYLKGDLFSQHDIYHTDKDQCLLCYRLKYFHLFTLITTLYHLNRRIKVHWNSGQVSNTLTYRKHYIWLPSFIYMTPHLTNRLFMVGNFFPHQFSQHEFNKKIQIVTIHLNL